VRLYVIGREGQIARSLREAAIGSADIVISYGGRPDVDILQTDLVEQTLLGFNGTRYDRHDILREASSLLKTPGFEFSLSR
jgi:dTDP-4-dehydrorhamnose reductase